MVAFKKWLAGLAKRTNAEAATPPRRSAPPCLEPLEDRSLPAVTGTLAGTTLTIMENSGAMQPFERIRLFRDVNNNLVLTNLGVETGRFAATVPITNIVINATALNVGVDVAPNVITPVTINGGPSVNNLQAGGGATNITAGPGANRIVGGLANDVVNATQPTSLNTIVDFNGTNNQVFVAGIQNVIYRYAPTTLVVAPVGTPILLNQLGNPPADLSQTLGLQPSPVQTLNPDQVTQLLNRASAATSSTDGIIAIVDRTGRILGVRIEESVFANLGIPTPPAAIQNNPAALYEFLGGPTSTLTPFQSYQLAFAVDGAVAKARTAAFFGNNQAPLTSRVVQNISQTTMTQREIESYPFVTLDNGLRGPGFVAPIGIKGHFPPGIAFTPQVDLFAIEHTNRDSSYHPNGQIKGDGNDVLLSQRFNVDPNAVPANVLNQFVAPDSYGYASGIAPNSQSRGIGTLPGGIPIYLPAANGQPVVVGGIGVFYPGATGFASEENSQLNETYDPSRPDRSLEAEFVAFAALGGAPLLDPSFAVPFVGVNNLPPVPGVVIPITPDAQRIDLVGITLDIIGPLGTNGPTILRDFAAANYQPGVVSGLFAPLLNPGGDNRINPPDQAVAANPFGITSFTAQLNGNKTLNGMAFNIPVDPGNQSVNALAGTFAQEGWLVNPQNGNGVTAAEVERMVQQGVAQALITRAAIRLPLDRNAVMVFAVSDLDGNIVGLFRMPDSTIFSIDVAVAKSRNVTYYASANVNTADLLPNFQPTIAFTNRTFRYLALPRFPEGIDFRPPGPFSILTDGNASLINGTLVGPPAPASTFDSVQGFDAFNPQTNFPNNNVTNPLNKNGIVFFPGAVPIYRGGAQMIGGVGISGDGVDQDDVVTFATKQGFENDASILRADQVFFQGVRLPFQKFNRQPLNP